MRRSFADSDTGEPWVEPGINLVTVQLKDSATLRLRVEGHYLDFEPPQLTASRFRQLGPGRVPQSP